MPGSQEPIVIKIYAGRRLHDTGTAAYLSLDDFAGMIRRREKVVVRNAGTGEDVTRSVIALTTLPLTEH